MGTETSVVREIPVTLYSVDTDRDWIQLDGIMACCPLGLYDSANLGSAFQSDEAHIIDQTERNLAG